MCKWFKCLHVHRPHFYSGEACAHPCLSKRPIGNPKNKIDIMTGFIGKHGNLVIIIEIKLFFFILLILLKHRIKFILPTLVSNQ